MPQFEQLVHIFTPMESNAESCDMILSLSLEAKSEYILADGSGQ